MTLKKKHYIIILKSNRSQTTVNMFPILPNNGKQVSYFTKQPESDSNHWHLFVRFEPTLGQVFFLKYYLRRVYTSGFRMHFTNCIAIFYNLPWLSKTKVNHKKLQGNAVNACRNRMCKLSFNTSIKVALVVRDLNIRCVRCVISRYSRFLAQKGLI